MMDEMSRLGIIPFRARIEEWSNTQFSKLQHTPRAHPRQSPWPTMKGIPAYSLLVKVAFRGVFQFGVLVHNIRNTIFSTGRWKATKDRYQKNRWIEFFSLCPRLFSAHSLHQTLPHKKQLVGVDSQDAWVVGLPVVISWVLRSIKQKPGGITTVYPWSMINDVVKFENPPIFFLEMGGVNFNQQKLGPGSAVPPPLGEVWPPGCSRWVGDCHIWR